MSAETMHRIEEASGPLWFGSGPASWGNVVRTFQPGEAMSADTAIEAADLAWRVDQYPLEAVAGEDGGGWRVAVAGHLANVRSDTRRVLGVVGERYRPLQNRDALALCDAITDSGRVHWLGAGSTRGGARVFALMQLDREIRLGNAEGEELLPLLLLRNGHDGRLAVTISVAPLRLACLNGMLLPLQDATRTWRARHTRQLEGKLGEARRALGLAWRYYDQLEHTATQLLHTPMGGGEFERFLTRLVPMPKPNADETNGGRRVRHVERVREAIRTAYTSAEDLNEVRGTAWGALQAVAAYVDHTQTVRGAGRGRAEARFERATQPSPLKDQALELLTNT